MMRLVYEALKWIGMAKALSRGPGAFIRQRIRAKIMKETAIASRRIFKP
jgi:hypothetical protein